MAIPNDAAAPPAAPPHKLQPHPPVMAVQHKVVALTRAQATAVLDALTPQALEGPHAEPWVDAGELEQLRAALAACGSLRVAVSVQFLAPA